MTDRPAQSRRPFDALPIARSLRCRDCGYDLRGLALGGACPECGAPIWQTVMAAIDPEGSRLPRLRNPRAVGLGLLLVSIAMLAMLLAPTAAPLVRLVALVFGSMPDEAIVADRLSLLGALAAILGLVGVVLLTPPRGTEAGGPIRPSLTAMGFGFVTWLVVGIVGAAHGSSRLRWLGRGSPDLGVDPIVAIVGVVALAGVFLAYGRILRIVGLRSREYRTATTSRQRMPEMAAAALIIAVSETVFVLASRARAEELALGATALTAVAWAMVGIGLLYLVLNTAWIARSLTRPPQTIAELLTPEPPPPTTDGSAAGAGTPGASGPPDPAAPDAP